MRALTEPAVHESGAFTHCEQMEHVNMSALESIIADQLQGMGFELEAVEGHNSPGADPDGGQRFLVDVKTRARHSVYEACGKDRRRCPCALDPGASSRDTPWGIGASSQGGQCIDSGDNAWIEGRGLTLWADGRRPVHEARAGLERPSRAFRPAGLRCWTAGRGDGSG